MPRSRVEHLMASPAGASHRVLLEQPVHERRRGVSGGASVKVAQELARHSTPNLTIGRDGRVWKGTWIWMARPPMKMLFSMRR